MKNLIWILAAIMLAGCGDNEEGQDMGLHEIGRASCRERV